MNPTLQDHVVLCDMDNTLLTAKEGLPDCNRAVLKLFAELGGRFTVATGRPPESIRAALGDIRLSLPVISCNGSLIYDLETNRVLHRRTVDRMQASLAINDIAEKFPTVGIEVIAGDGDMYVLRANTYTHAHQVDEHIGSTACPIESVPEAWLKVIFADAPDTIERIRQYVKGRYYGRDNYFVHTNSIYFEIMPEGVSKASALQHFCLLTGIHVKQVVAIGDYYNDLEIMRAAGYSVAVANAPAPVRAEADEVTVCTCSEGAVGEYLYKLISGRRVL